MPLRAHVIEAYRGTRRTQAFRGEGTPLEKQENARGVPTVPVSAFHDPKGTDG